jgi:uncharacterized cupin superfamily protein
LSDGLRVYLLRVSCGVWKCSSGLWQHPAGVLARTANATETFTALEGVLWGQNSVAS